MALEFPKSAYGNGPPPLPCVYKITNLVTGAAYIGATRKGANIRFLFHLKDSKRNDSVLYRAIRKYGKDAFKVEVLAELPTVDGLFDLEVQLIKEHRTFVDFGGYNMTPGGEGSTEICELTRERMRRAAVIRMQNPETRKKISRAQKGRKLSPERIEKSAAGRRGKPLTQQHKETLSRVHSGKIISPEQRAKISRSLTGRSFTAERCEAISAANRRYWARRRAALEASNGA